MVAWDWPEMILRKHTKVSMAFVVVSCMLQVAVRDTLRCAGKLGNLSDDGTDSPATGLGDGTDPPPTGLDDGTDPPPT